MAFDVKASREHLSERLAQQRGEAEERRLAALAAARAGIRRAAPSFATVRRVYLFGSVVNP